MKMAIHMITTWRVSVRGLFSGDAKKCHRKSWEFYVVTSAGVD